MLPILLLVLDPRLSQKVFVWDWLGFDYDAMRCNVLMMMVQSRGEVGRKGEKREVEG